MRKILVGSAVLAVAASAVAMAPASAAEVIGPDGKIRVTAEGAFVDSLFGDLTVVPGLEESRQITIYNQSSDRAVLTVDAIAAADRHLAADLSLCWSSGSRTFGQLAQGATVGSTILDPGASTVATIGYRYADDAVQAPSGSQASFGLKFNLRQATADEKAATATSGGESCSVGANWEQKPGPAVPPTPQPDEDKPGKPEGEKPSKPEGNGKPDTPDGDKPEGNGNPDKPKDDKPGKPDTPDSDKPGKPDSDGPGKPGKPEGEKPGKTDGDHGKPDGTVDSNKPSGASDDESSPVAAVDGGPDKSGPGTLAVAGADIWLTTGVGATLLTVGSWLMVKRRSRKA